MKDLDSINYASPDNGNFSLTSHMNQVGRPETRVKRRSHEVLDAHPEIGQFLTEKVNPQLLTFPDIWANLFVVGESGTNKGILAGQIADFLQTHQEMRGRLTDVGIPNGIMPHYIGTGGCFEEAAKRGAIDLEKWGNFSQDDWNVAMNIGEEALTAAELHFPKKDPTHAHLGIGEFAVSAHNFNSGNSIIRQKAVRRNTFGIFVVTNQEIQERAREQRKGLWTPESDKNEVVMQSNTSYDIHPEDAKYTMGNDKAIEFTRNLTDEGMLEAQSDPDWKELPTDMWHFTKDSLKDPEIRSQLQERYYHFLARKLGFDSDNILIYKPRFVKKKIHGYPGYLKSHAIPFVKIPDPSVEKVA
jgi:hypothetical protein